MNGIRRNAFQLTLVLTFLSLCCCGFTLTCLSKNFSPVHAQKRNFEYFMTATSSTDGVLGGETIAPLLENDMTEKKNEKCNAVFLLSFPPATERGPRIVRDVWKWKDAVLGDGRDYFVPRKRALKALSDIVVGTTYGNITIVECAILSNCARMDVLIYTTDPVNDKIANENVVKRIISSIVLSQLSAYIKQRSNRGTFMEGFSSFFDLPGMVDEFTKVSSTTIEYNELELVLDVKSEIDEIFRHFCLVASGLAPRASRPDRQVTFRPFHSRDAHIMLQLKRTAEVASQYPVMKIILDSALTAGKGARNPKQCPSLKKLKGYDAEGKYSQAAPLQLSQEVSNDVKKTIIEPIIQKGTERIIANNASRMIVYLREEAEKLSDQDNKRAQKFIRRRLHEPTMKLRAGRSVDVDRIIRQLRDEMTNV